MTGYIFRKLDYNGQEVYLMFEQGEIQKPMALLYPGDVDSLIKLRLEKKPSQKTGFSKKGEKQNDKRK